MLTKIISVSLLVIAFVVVSFVFLRPTNQPQPKREVAISEEAASTVDNVSARQLTPYSQENLATATANGGKALIFFHAGWCPFCIAAEKDILSKFEQIPDDVTIMKADYDMEKDLKQKYGVTTQHTFVQVDQDGNEITQWVGGENLEDILSRLQ
ncbi:hypothetical protein IPM65_02595 [Candidatus Roizmanbacteria bacterium]|nr:MAG: hypothetical protein IPM65_02595 [Candidatus Roizmanbacteria bacterium]